MIDKMYKTDTFAKDRFMHGSLYHMLWDRPLAEVRRQVVDYIPKGSSVLDIACGTGELCFELAAAKNCQIVGLDISKRMIDFASKRNRYQDVHFVLGDGANLDGFKPLTFDFATILLLLHEVPKCVRIAAINEALRVARKAIIIDSLAPLPKNIHGIALRIVEAIGGHQHYNSFANFLRAGGISSVLGDLSVDAAVIQRGIFWNGCREMVVIERQERGRN